MNRMDVTDTELMDFLATQESQYLVDADSCEEKVLERLRFGNKQFGDPLPWTKTHNVFRFRPGEVSIWAGINGHGKSIMQGMAMLWLMPHTKIMIASLEMKPEATLIRMLRQASGGEQPSEAYVRGWLKQSKDHLWMYDQLDTVPADRIIAAVHYAAVKLGCKHVVIDSLMKCGIGTDDFNSQKGFADRLCWAAKAHDIHVHLIHHMRKGMDEAHAPGKFDVKGAGELVDQVDNLLIVHRNKRKEMDKEQSKDVDDDVPDATLSVRKQRHGEWEGRFALWFNGPSQQYTPNPANRPMPWPDPEVQRDYVEVSL